LAYFIRDRDFKDFSVGIWGAARSIFRSAQRRPVFGLFGARVFAARQQLTREAFSTPAPRICAESSPNAGFLSPFLGETTPETKIKSHDHTKTKSSLFHSTFVIVVVVVVVVRLLKTTRSVDNLMGADRVVVDVMDAGMFTPRLHAEAV
jgi:hypothetical protein